jgi:hypothetical protein
MEDATYDPPAYLWAITTATTAAIPAATCIVLYGGAKRAGLGRRRAALLAGGAAAWNGRDTTSISEGPQPHTHAASPPASSPA